MNARSSITIALTLTLAASTSASAANFFVNETVDNYDTIPGDGVCSVPFTGKCSLRAAIQEANAWPGPDDIWLGQGTFTLARQGVGEDNAATGDLDITEAVNIRGIGRGKTVISAGFIDRVFEINAPVGSVGMSDLQIRYGNPPVGGGGGIRNKSGQLLLVGVSVFGNVATGGAGILNEGTATLLDSEVSYNFTYAATTGGGVTNAGSLSMKRSSIHDNGADLKGGGIFNLGTLSIEISTIANNSPDGINSTSNPGSSSVVVLGSTIADNDAWGLWISGSGLAPTLTCTIVSGHLNADCISGTTPPISSGGFNLSGDGSCSDVQTDRVGDPLLGPLTGWPPARAPRIGSPAIDGGSNALCPISDQWARARTMDGDRDGTATADIGALEDVLLFADGFESGDISAWSP